MMGENVECVARSRPGSDYVSLPRVTLNLNFTS
jgi:hypothetical protein